MDDVDDMDETEDKDDMDDTDGRKARVRTTPATFKRYGQVPLFDPERGKTVIPPEATGNGYWVGAPSVLYKPHEGVFYLSYRVRRPRPERGVESRIARSPDGVHFEDVWRVHKSQLSSDSIERCSLTLGLDGIYRLYISYVDPQDGRWRVDVMESRSPTGFQVNDRQKVLTAADVSAAVARVSEAAGVSEVARATPRPQTTGGMPVPEPTDGMTASGPAGTMRMSGTTTTVEAVKDPVVYVMGRQYYMILSYAPTPATTQPETWHSSGDIFNTGVTKSHTGLAVSTDGVHYEWQGDILSPSQNGWDSYAARIASLLYVPPFFTAFYDGSASVTQNYEERSGLAIGPDLRHLERVSVDGPVLVSAHAPGTLRYIDAVSFRDEIYYYYEYVRADGSHELRLNRVSW